MSVATSILGATFERKRSFDSLLLSLSLSFASFHFCSLCLIGEIPFRFRLILPSYKRCLPVIVKKWEISLIVSKRKKSFIIHAVTSEEVGMKLQ